MQNDAHTIERHSGCTREALGMHSGCARDVFASTRDVLEGL